MLHGTPSPGGAGSELTRLLARLGDAPPAPHRPAFAERLGQWLDWTGAISLSAALDAGATASADGRTAPPPGGAEADFQRVRAVLEASIAASPRDGASSPTDFASHRRHCVRQQQAMQESVGALRQRLRDALAQRSPELARLAAIDAVMDRAVSAQERSLLGRVPARLQAHFEQLQRSAQVNPQWLQTFREDLTRLLQAELEHRLLPAQGLLDTLRSNPPT